MGDRAAYVFHGSSYGFSLRQFGSGRNARMIVPRVIVARMLAGFGTAEAVSFPSPLLRAL